MSVSPTEYMHLLKASVREGEMGCVPYAPRHGGESLRFAGVFLAARYGFHPLLPKRLAA
jgi:hypothetical protein